MFNPRQIVFAPTTDCNLRCDHCRVERGTDGSLPRLSSQSAIAFLDSCMNHEIDRVGFSGGEPFLALDFLCTVSTACVERGLFFDRLMTNACWFTTDEELQQSLQTLYKAGFDGSIAISVDAYHGSDPAQLGRFIRAVIAIWGRADCLELVSVFNRDGSWQRDCFDAIASELGASLKLEAGLPLAIQDQRYLENRRSQMEDGSGLYMPILLVPYSASADEPEAWKAAHWFKDDYCEGPGQLFYVHPNGNVAVCCGFANENPQLIIGTIDDGYGRLMASAADNQQVGRCYQTGLGQYRQELAAAGHSFPGVTDDICCFCDYVCRLADSQD